jgi:hypothetical protein
LISEAYVFLAQTMTTNAAPTDATARPTGPSRR